MSSEFIVFGQPDIGEEEIAEVVATMRSRWLGTGPRVAQFEREFAEYRGVSPDRVAAVNSGTAALHLALLGSGVGPGDEVILPAMTFCATVNAVIHSGATPVLADVEQDTMNLCPDDVRRRITSRTKALLPVHFAGRSCDMGTLMTIADEHGLRIVEDCAHAIETDWKGAPAGTLGDFGCFSFYVTKNATTGEGGMVIAREASDIERIKVHALHGMSKDAWHRFGDSGYRHYDVVAAGFKYNMMDLQAAIGLHQLRRIEKNLEARRVLREFYIAELSDLPVTLPVAPDGSSRHAHHLFPILVDLKLAGTDRDAMLDAMTNLGIGVGVHYRSISAHSFYADRFGFDPTDTPVSTRIGEQTVSLPFSSAVTVEQRERIVRAVRSVIEGGSAGTKVLRAG